MPRTSTFPPYVDKHDRVILFDGICHLCSGSVQFILKHDTEGLFRLASVQSQQGQIILDWFGMPTNHFATMLYIENGQLFTKSMAILKIVEKLPFPWSLLRAFIAIPRPIRDWFYDRLALNRYKLFGTLDHCFLPDPEYRKRFLDAD